MKVLRTTVWIGHADWEVLDALKTSTFPQWLETEIKERPNVLAAVFERLARSQRALLGSFHIETDSVLMEREQDDFEINAKFTDRYHGGKLLLIVEMRYPLPSATTELISKLETYVESQYARIPEIDLLDELATTYAEMKIAAQ